MDASDSSLIDGAMVNIKAGNNSDAGSGTTGSIDPSKGKIVFQNLTPDTYTITVSKEGYAANPQMPRVFFGSASGINTFDTQSSPADVPAGGRAEADFKFQKLSATVELLVGGPYGDHPYGHTAIRVVTDRSDRTYDYGRYGKTWGTGGSKGEGMLRVWTDFQRYITGENALGRTTSGFKFRITSAESQKINDYLTGKTSGITPNQNRGYMQQFKIEEYDALTCNCATLSVDGTKQALTNVDAKYADFQEGRGLSLVEKAAAKVVGYPKRTFMPGDLRAQLSSMDGPDKPTSESFSSSP